MSRVSSVKEAKRLEISWTRALGSALGAVSAAVLLSTLGAAGTLIGAALGSLCITIGGAVYAHSLELTKDKVAYAHRRAERAPRQQRDGLPASGGGGRTESRAPTAGPTAAKDLLVDDAEASSSSRGMRVLHGLPWKRIVLASTALFGVVVVLILAFELSTGRAVSSLTGGSSDTDGGVSTFIPGLEDQTRPTDDVGEQDPTKDQGDPAPETVPSQEPTDVAPSEQDQAPQDQPTTAPNEETPAATPTTAPPGGVPPKPSP